MTNNDRIDLYLTDRMSASERASFEREMTEDSALAQEVALQRELVRAIQSKGAKEYLQQVEKIFSAGKKIPHIQNLCTRNRRCCVPAGGNIFPNRPKSNLSCTWVWP